MMLLFTELCTFQPNLSVLLDTESFPNVFESILPAFGLTIKNFDWVVDSSPLTFVSHKVSQLYMYATKMYEKIAREQRIMKIFFPSCIPTVECDFSGFVPSDIPRSIYTNNTLHGALIAKDESSLSNLKSLQTVQNIGCEANEVIYLLDDVN